MRNDYFRDQTGAKPKTIVQVKTTRQQDGCEDGQVVGQC